MTSDLHKNAALLSRHNNVSWAVFDPNFYAASNPASVHHTDTESLLQHYLAEGATAGFSPNRWFDEGFYRRFNPEVEELIRSGRLTSGFEHYCETGYPTQVPHWLFNPAFYAEENPGLTDAVLIDAGFANAYDHFLKYGVVENRVGHPFFDPIAYGESLDPQTKSACAGVGAFKHFLSQSWRGDIPGSAEPCVSRNFDPALYRATYPHVAEEVRAGLWQSALHHYLANHTAGSFRPFPPTPHFADESRAPQTAQPRIKIHIDRPRHVNGEAVEPIDGYLDVIGWAAANHPVSAVDVYVDGEHFGRARHGIRTEGVAAAFPELTNSMFAGFRFIGPASAEPGRHMLRIVARGETGVETSAEFAAEFKQAVVQDGPWCLRRRMRFSEAELKTRLLDKGGLKTQFVVVLTNTLGKADVRQRTVNSLQRQVYTRWRLHDVHSPLDDNLIAAPDCWFVLLSPGDELGVDALLELVLHRLTQPAADFLYSDERRIDPASAVMAPFFKPDWSPDLLIATDYIGRLWTAAAGVVARAGLSRDSLAEHGNHDVVLRLTEHAHCIGHVPLVLCESTPHPADRSAVQRALVRRGIAGQVETGRVQGSWHIRQALPHLPLVSVIIPTASTCGLVLSALHTLRDGTAYPNLEIIVIDKVPDTEAPSKAALRAVADQVIEARGPLNWSSLNNLAAGRATGDALLFLSDNVGLPDKDADPAWLQIMVEQLLCPGVGIVGPQLLCPGGLVEQAGRFLHRSGDRGAFAGLPSAEPGPFGLALTQRNVSAVTGACLLTRRTIFEQLGRFDERLDIASSDSDLCLRCMDAGLRVVYTPHATLMHHESVVGINLAEAANETLFAKIWKSRLAAGDPYFNRHLSITHSDYRPDPEFVDIIYPARPLAAPETIRRILVIKLDHVGDFILSLPAIRRLKQSFGNARLTLLAAPNVSKLAALEPAIDGCIPFEFFHPRSADGLRDIGAVELTDLTTQLHAETFDLAIDLRCHHQTRYLLRCTGATWLAGFDGAFDFPWLDIVGVMEPDTERGIKRIHAASILLDFVERIVSSFQFAWTDRTLTTGFDAPSTLSLPPHGTRMRIAIHPGAGNTNKQWPAAHFGELIDQLTEEFDCSILLVGSKDEVDTSTALLTPDRVACGVMSIVGQTTLEQLAGLIAACDLFIGNDSGPHHLAACLGIPTIGVHSGIVDVHEWSPLGSSAVAVHRRVVCSPCYLAQAEDCPRGQACLVEIIPSAIMALVRRLLAPDRS